jgi:hypothetical protein
MTHMWSTRRRGTDAGFTVVEMLVATAIMMAVTGATFALMNPAQGVFAAQPEVMDMQQRLRVGVDTLQKDLLMAGGGVYSMASGDGKTPKSGALTNYFAPIMPYRVGNVSADPAGNFFTDRITIMYVPPTSAQTSIRDAMPTTSAEIKVDAQKGCPMKGASKDPLCGFKNGMTVMIMDESGSWDTFTITNVQSDAMHLQHQGEDLNKPYGTDAQIAQVAIYTYWLKTNTVAETYQLMRYDGNVTDVPIAENVVGLQFEYYGEAAPPELRPGMQPPTTYGPKPPALGTDNSADNWGAGENCVFTLSSGNQVPRLGWLATGSHGLVKLTESQLEDGPWCPDSAAAGRYDADLLRIRKIRVTLRVQVGSKMLRGSGSLFTRAGYSRGGERFIPDQEIKFDVTPRNISLGR